MKAKKSLGQNFLVDNNIIEKIVGEVTSNSNDLIVEIGPGRGALTNKLKLKNSYLIAYEVDRDLSDILNKLVDEKTKIIWQDFLRSNINEDIKNIKYNKLYIVGNLPYYITTPIIEHIIDSNITFEKLIIMVQKEVADRFLAIPKTKEYGYISVLLQYYFDIKKVCNVSKNSFNPIPKVESTVLTFINKNDNKIKDIEKYREFLKMAFRQKRKTLKNNLNNVDWLVVKNILDKYNLSESVRAEEIDGEIFIEIFNKLYFPIRKYNNRK